jgi:hypothetical protein
MKHVFENRYLKELELHSANELLNFLNKQTVAKKLSIDDSLGENYYCVISYDSLKKEKEFIISFSTAENIENLNFLFWTQKKMFVLDTGKKIHIISENLKIIKSYEITTPIIGLHVTKSGNLLILEEAFVRVVDASGTILQSELCDLIDEFNIKNNILFIKTNETSKSITLM